jgi:hypothetical protein
MVDACGRPGRIVGGVAMRADDARLAAALRRKPLWMDCQVAPPRPGLAEDVAAARLAGRSAASMPGQPASGSSPGSSGAEVVEAVLDSAVQSLPAIVQEGGTGLIGVVVGAFLEGLAGLFD